MSIDDLYNNFKIVEQEVKKSIGASTGTQNLTFMTASGTSTTNNVNTANSEVSTVSTNANTASTENSTANLSDATVYAFLSNQPKGSQLVHKDLEQIHDGDLEEMDLKWQLALLSVRARKFYQRTGKKIIINGSDTAGYDKSKVECFNCHKMGHFARECRAPRNKDGQFRNQDNRNWSQDNSKRIVNVEDTSSKAMLAIDGIGFDWSDMVEEQVQINMALMAFSDSEVYTDKTCSKTCLKNYETLKKQCDDLIVKLNDTEFKAATYKRGLATVEDQLVSFRKNEVLFSEEIVVLKREVGCKYYELGVLKAEYEKVKQEKEGIDFKITKYDNASKDIDKLLASQITDKSKKGLGYHAVAPPHPLSLNAPTKLDLSYSGLDEFQEPKFNEYGPRDTVLNSANNCDKESDNSKENTDDTLEKEQVSDSENNSVESPLRVDKETFIDWKEIVFHTAKKFGISSWRGSRVDRRSYLLSGAIDGRSYLLSGAIDGSEANGIIRDPKSCKVRVSSNGNLLWELTVLLDEEEKKERKVYVKIQQRGMEVQETLSRGRRNQTDNVPVLLHCPKKRTDFVIYYDRGARYGSKHGSVLVREREMLYRRVGRRSEAKNEFEIDVRRSDLGLRKGCWWHKIRCPKQRTRQHKMLRGLDQNELKRDGGSGS
ncbi:ribonuclease H-like domain-containing protein [Tanacetum coccineum]